MSCRTYESYSDEHNNPQLNQQRATYKISTPAARSDTFSSQNYKKRNYLIIIFFICQNKCINNIFNIPQGQSTVNNSNVQQDEQTKTTFSSYWTTKEISN